MGDILTSTFGKCLAKKGATIIRIEIVEKHQWGLSLSGACESLCHWRATIDAMPRMGMLGPVLICDIDRINMFGMAE